MWGYTTFIHNSFDSLDLAMTLVIICFAQNLAITSWSNLATCMAVCLNIMFGLEIDEKYSEKSHDLLFSYNINHIMGINAFA